MATKTGKSTAIFNQRGTSHILTECPYCGEKYKIEKEQFAEALWGNKKVCVKCSKNFKITSKAMNDSLKNMIHIMRMIDSICKK